MKPLALTMGEPAGIGAEITGGAWRALCASGPAFVLLDDAGRDFGLPVQAVASAGAASDVFARALPVLHRALAQRPLAGRTPALR